MAEQQETVIGKVSFIINGVTVKGSNGEIREIYVNSPIFIGDTILTGENGMVTLIIGEGEGIRVDLGRSSELLLDEQFLSENYADSYDNTEQLKMALLEGEFDPTEEFAAPASGGEAPSGGGGQHVFQVDLTGQELLASPMGLETEGSNYFFADIVNQFPSDGEEVPVLPVAAPVRAVASAAESEDDVLTFEGSVFGYSSFTSNFPLLEMMISQMSSPMTMRSVASSEGTTLTLSDLLEQYLGDLDIDWQNFGTGTPDAQVIAEDLPNEDLISSIETSGNLGEFEYSNGALKFTPSENFSGDASITFTIVYSDGTTQDCSADITERYLKVGSIFNDQDGYSEFGVGYVVGEGSGTIEGGEAGDILVGDSFNMGDFSLRPSPPQTYNVRAVEGGDVNPTPDEGYNPVPDDGNTPFMSDQIEGGGGDDFIVGDSLDTRILNGQVFTAINEQFGTNFDFEEGEGPNLGWYAFTLLEVLNEDWDRNETIAFLLEEENQIQLNIGNWGINSFFGGDDIIDAGAGDDLVFGNGGNDTILGGDGDDKLIGGFGDDVMGGGDGDDSLFGGVGRDALAGDEGDDRIIGGFGQDLLVGGNGRDIILGGPGSDIITGDNAVVFNGDVVIAEDDERDLIFGGSGEDSLANVGRHEAASSIETIIEQAIFVSADNVDELAPLLPEIEVTG